MYPGQKIGLITHSMGGIVASLALTMAPELFDSIFFMMSLSTPWENHPLNPDLQFPQIYKTIHQFWEEERMFTLSVTGGVRDLLVPPQFSNLQALNNKTALHIYSTEIEGLHLEMDHLAIVWGEEFFAKIAVVLNAIMPLSDPAEMRRATETVISSQLASALQQQPPLREMQLLRSPDKLTPIKIGLSIELDPGSAMESASTDDLLLLYDDDTYVVQDGFEISSDGIDFDDGYLLRVLGSAAVFSDVETEVSIQRVMTHGPISFFSAALGHVIDVPTNWGIGMRLRPGASWSSGRFPLRIAIYSEGQTKAVYAQCGSEKYVKKNENEFTLYFHEFCPDGPEIWILGFDPEHTFQVVVKWDIMGSFVCFLRDLRIHICTMALGMTGLFSVVQGTALLYYIVSVGVGMYFFGNELRQIGLFGYDQVHDVQQDLGVLEIAYIMCLSYGLMLVLKQLFELARYVRSYIPMYVRSQWLLPPLLGVYHAPWVVVIVCLVIRMQQFKPEYLFVAWGSWIS